MTDINFLVTLIAFYFVMYATPGPNNALVLASGLKFGFLKTIPVMAGITVGHIIQLIIVCLGFGKVFQLYPNIQIWLKILCSAYMVYLCYKVIGSLSSFKQNDAKPIKFYEAALFQIVNPKAWTISTMAASGFIINEANLIESIIMISSVALIVCPLSISPWAGFGSAIKTFIKNRRAKIIIEYTLAALLLITAALIILEIR